LLSFEPERGLNTHQPSDTSTGNEDKEEDNSDTHEDGRRKQLVFGKDGEFDSRLIAGGTTREDRSFLKGNVKVRVRIRPS
jgi:hypothetical protein